MWWPPKMEKFPVYDYEIRGGKQSGMGILVMGKPLEFYILCIYTIDPHEKEPARQQGSNVHSVHRSPTWNHVADDTRKLLEVAFREDGEFWYVYVRNSRTALSPRCFVRHHMAWPFFFRISYKDVLKHFSKLEICNLGPETMVSVNGGSVQKLSITWQANIFGGSWTNGVSAGGCRNNPGTKLHLQPLILYGFCFYETVEIRT